MIRLVLMVDWWLLTLLQGSLVSPANSGGFVRSFVCSFGWFFLAALFAADKIDAKVRQDVVFKML